MATLNEKLKIPAILKIELSNVVDGQNNIYFHILHTNKQIGNQHVVYISIEGKKYYFDRQQH